MKKMLDELKKLDEEYVVPADFKNKVMQKVREINMEEMKQRKSKTLVKYVIPCLTSAAVVLIACIVTINNGLGNKSADAIYANQSIALDGTLNDFASISSLEKEFSSDNFESKDELLNKEESKPASTETVNEQMFTVEDSALDSIRGGNIKEIISFDSAEKLKNKEIIDILLDANIEIIEETTNYIIVKSELEILDEALKDFQGVKMSIVENNIKIEF